MMVAGISGPNADAAGRSLRGGQNNQPYVSGIAAPDSEVLGSDRKMVGGMRSGCTAWAGDGAAGGEEAAGDAVGTTACRKEVDGNPPHSSWGAESSELEVVPPRMD